MLKRGGWSLAQVLHLHRLVVDRGDETTPAWRRQAACKGLDPGIFHPDEEDVASVEAAVAICRGCPVRQSCFEYAIASREPDGVWGGRTARERRREIRRRRRTA